MGKNNKISTYEPTRMCKVCRKKVSKKLLSRYVKMSDKTNETYVTFGNMILDKDNCLSGRGFYVCEDQVCQEKFQKLKMKK